MEEFNQDDAEVNAPSAVRYVISGLLILASGIIFIPLMNSHWIKYITLAVFGCSFLVMTGSRSRKSSG